MLSDCDVSLADEDTSVMDAVGKLSLHHEGLESAFHELAHGQTEDVIELTFRVLEETKTDHAADKSLAYSKFKL